jgi:hypothetical protein
MADQANPQPVADLKEKRSLAKTATVADLAFPPGLA